MKNQIFKFFTILTMNPNIKSAFTQWLITGYANKQCIPIDRAGNPWVASDVKTEHFHYHDERFYEKHLGGGQELVNVDGIRYMRLYAWGTPVEWVLHELNIDTREVNGYLKKKIIELWDTTRLNEDCFPVADGAWKYEYRVQWQEWEVVIWYERIFYQDIQVHFHAFIICPIK